MLRFIFFLVALTIQPIQHATALINPTGARSYYYQRKLRLRASLLDQSGGALYRRSVFDQNEFALIQKGARLLSLQDETSNIAFKRQGAKVPANNPISELLRSPDNSLTQYVRKTCFSDLVIADTVPLEIRSYEKKGASMAWHRDDILFDPPQIEIVFTIENTSNCETMYNNQCVETEPNSALILIAGGPRHCVTSLRYGQRKILKLAYRRQDAQLC